MQSTAKRGRGRPRKGSFDAGNKAKTLIPIVEIEELKPVVALYCTIKTCVLCDEILKEKTPWNEDSQKKLESFCTFLNIDLGQRYSWDFEQENYPFCSDCTSLLDYLHILYTRLEELHTFVALGVRKIRQTVSKVKSTGSEGEADDSQSSSTKASSGSVEYRVKFIRGLIMSMTEDNDEVPIILPRLDKIIENLNGGETERVEIGVQANPMTDNNDPTASKVDAGVQTNILVKVYCDTKEGKTYKLMQNRDPSLLKSKPSEVVQLEEDDADITILDEESNELGSGTGEKENSAVNSSIEKESNVDEFQAFLEAELAKRRRAALLAAQHSNNNLINKDTTAKVTRKKAKKGTVAVDKQVEADASIINQPQVSDKQQIVTAETNDDDPDIIEIIEEKKGGPCPRRSIRSKRRVKYRSDEKHSDEDFSIKKELESSDSDDNMPGSEKRKRRKLQRPSSSCHPKSATQKNAGTPGYVTPSPAGTNASENKNHEVDVSHPESLNSAAVPITDTPCLELVPRVEDYDYFRIVNSEIQPTPPEILFAEQIEQTRLFEEALQNY